MSKARSRVKATEGPSEKKEFADCGLKKVEVELNRRVKPVKYAMNRVDCTRKANSRTRSEHTDINSRENNSLFIAKPKEEYIYDQIEKKYKEKETRESIEKQRLELAMRRNRYKPITREELTVHSNNYLRYVKDQEEARRLKQLHAKHEGMINELDQRRFETNVSLAVRLEDAVARRNLAKRAEERKKVREKIAMYASIVQSVKPVVASEEKSAELCKMVARLKHPVRQPRNVKADYEISKIVGRRKNTLSKQSHVESEFSKLTSPKRSPKSSPPELEDTEASERKRVVEITKKLKEQRKIPRYNWKKMIMSSSLSIREKVNAVIEQGKIIERQANMKEERMLAGGLEGDLSLGEYGSEILLNSIKAKLAILEQC